jgi:hypothetical protein
MHTTSNRQAFVTFGQFKHDAALRAAKKVQDILGLETEGFCLVFGVPWMNSALDSGGVFLGDMVFASVTEISDTGPVSKILLETPTGWIQVKKGDIKII